jgi:hypothetical protein
MDPCTIHSNCIQNNFVHHLVKYFLYNTLAGCNPVEAVFFNSGLSGITSFITVIKLLVFHHLTKEEGGVEAEL